MIVASVRGKDEKVLDIKTICHIHQIEHRRLTYIYINISISQRKGQGLIEKMKGFSQKSMPPICLIMFPLLYFVSANIKTHSTCVQIFVNTLLGTTLTLYG